MAVDVFWLGEPFFESRYSVIQPSTALALVGVDSDRPGACGSRGEYCASLWVLGVLTSAADWAILPPSLKIFRPWTFVWKEGGAAVAVWSSGEDVHDFLDRALTCIFIWGLVAA